jgi:hypothetical protein
VKGVKVRNLLNKHVLWENIVARLICLWWSTPYSCSCSCSKVRICVSSIYRASALFLLTRKTIELNRFRRFEHEHEHEINLFAPLFLDGIARLSKS